MCLSQVVIPSKGAATNTMSNDIRIMCNSREMSVAGEAAWPLWRHLEEEPAGGVIREFFFPVNVRRWKSQHEHLPRQGTGPESACGRWGAQVPGREGTVDV